jgi:hypothetical protein
MRGYSNDVVEEWLQQRFGRMWWKAGMDVVEEVVK